MTLPDDWLAFGSFDDFNYIKLQMETPILKKKIQDLENEIKNLKKQIHDPVNNKQLDSNEQIQKVIDNIYNMYLSTKTSSNLYMQMVADLQKSNSIL